MKTQFSASFFIALALFTGCGTQETESQVNEWSESARAYNSRVEERWDEQTKVDAAIPGHASITWTVPAAHTDFGGFWSYNIHEGVDYVHTNRNVRDVPVLAAADGEVVYIRIGCTESTPFGRNESLRRCGAGWGNHIVIKHSSSAGTIYTRYAHLRAGGTSVNVGQRVRGGQQIAIMGNTGSSNERHLHFEMGTRAQAFNPRAGSQMLDKVYNPQKVRYGVAASAPTPPVASASQDKCWSETHNRTPFQYRLTAQNKLRVLRNDGSQAAELDARAARYDSRLEGRDVIMHFDATSGTGARLFIYTIGRSIFLKHDGQGDGVPMKCNAGIIRF